MMKIKNNFLLLLVLLSACRCLGQQAAHENSFTLHGKIPNTNLDSVSLEYITKEGKYTHFIVSAPQGNFEFTGNIDQPSFAFLLFKHKGEVMDKYDVELKRHLIYIEPTAMEIDTEANAKKMVLIKGSKTQEEWNGLMAQTFYLQAPMDSLHVLNKGALHGESKLNLADQAKLAALQKQINLVYYDFFIAHPNSYVSADRAMYLTTVYGLDSLKRIYNNFGPGVKESMGARRMASVITSRETGLKGSTAYPFTATDKEGNPLSLASFKGKYIVLDFWATWCIPCRKAMPHMVSLYQKYKGKNLEFIAIGDDDRNAVAWKAAIEKDGTGMFHHVLRGVNMELAIKGLPNPHDIAEQYGVRSLPTQFLIDPQGKIIGRFDGSGNPDGDLEKL